MHSTQAEQKLCGPQLRYVIGVDEAGRGCMAGPVSVAAVCFALSDRAAPFTMEDSKVMSAAAREQSFQQLCAALCPDDTGASATSTLAALDDATFDGRFCRLAAQLGDQSRTVLGFASALIPAAEIDRVNILNATLEGMSEVVHALVCALRAAGEEVSAATTMVLIDGPHRPWTFLPPDEHARKIKLALKRGENPPKCQGRMYPTTLQPLLCTPVIGGDGAYLSIATASVVAKVIRDAYVEGLMETQCPQYGFAHHKGYCTADHKKALAQHGPCVFHRREYAPVKAITEKQKTDAPGKKRPRSDDS